MRSLIYLFFCLMYLQNAIQLLPRKLFSSLFPPKLKHMYTCLQQLNMTL